jgi:hypothetical protein
MARVYPVLFYVFDLDRNQYCYGLVVAGSIDLIQTIITDNGILYHWVDGRLLPDVT